MSTTGLMDAHNRDWSYELIDAIGLPRELFPPPERAGQQVGEWRETPVHLVGSHDTASAFLGAPITGPGSVVVSTGSWVIVGVERDAPETSSAARAANFSNEAGALGGTRFLKNVVGFWILEQCRAAWGDPPIEDLVAEAAAVDQSVPTFDASDHRFVSPDNMLSEVLSASGLSSEASHWLVARSIIESIVEGVLAVVAEIESTTGVPCEDLAVIGGGARIPLLARLLEEQSGRDVVVGSPEAAAMGNAIVQGLALGRFADLAEARRWLAPSGVAA
jgi:rhamnulokinase